MARKLSDHERDGLVLQVLVHVRGLNPPPAAELLPRDDPHDSGLWQSWREDLDAHLLTALAVHKLEVRELIGDRSSLGVELADGSRHSVYI